MYIDNCASGGRRIDIESLDRSVIMSRSDYCCSPTIDPIGGQTQNYGIMHWVPLSATINYTRPENSYNFRSDMNAGIQISPFDSHGQGKNGLSHIPAGYPFGWQRKMMHDYKQARPFFYGDYYTLTNNSLSPVDWTSYQLDRPDLSEGIVLAFRRPQSPFTEARFVLKGIDEKARYQFENADSGEKILVDGKTIATGGFTIKMQQIPDSQLWYYKKIK
jgi:alpha-galactosidase